MLGLGTGLSLTGLGTWLPSNETSLELYCQNQTGITEEVGVASWKDISGNNRDMVQADDTEKPAYRPDTGEVTFDGNDNLQTTGQVTLDGEFIIGLRISFTDLANEVIIADNTTANNFIRLNNSSTIGLKFSSTQSTIALNDPLIVDTIYSLTITRNAANLVEVYIDGVLQNESITKTGTLLLDALGVRQTDINDIAGSMYEVIVYSKHSDIVVAETNTRLNSI